MLHFVFLYYSNKISYWGHYMLNQDCQMSENKLLQHLGNLRKMMIANHELENLSEFVLHDLCSGPCAHVEKAAYFVNNPDFHILRGVAGYHKQESAQQVQDRWNNQQQFISYMQSSDFNKKVRKQEHVNFEKNHASAKYAADKLADFLEIENPAYHVWDLKHANHGLLVYQASQEQHKQAHHYMLDSLYYLSFCPVF